MYVREKFKEIRQTAEIADIGFLLLRIIILAGGYGWLIFSLKTQFLLYEGAPTPVRVSIFYSILTYFILYSLLIYLLLFINFKQKRPIYTASLFLDLSFIFLLIKYSGGFESSFFIGFYLVTALHAFYFGYLFGLGAATVSTIIYLISGDIDFDALHWTDFLLRISFLYLLAVPLGLLSEKLKDDNEKIEQLNADLMNSIEDLKNLQHKLVQAEKLSALGRLTSDVAHEIRNPLTAIGGFARRLKKRLQEGTNEKEYASLMVSEVDRLERILRDVLSFSREARYHLAQMDLDEIISETLKTFQSLCSEQSITVIKSFDPDLPKVLLDKDQVIQALTNLITNAIDAMPDGGTLTVKTRTAIKHNVQYVVIDIIDTGEGIRQDRLERLFEPFHSTKDIGHGTGLGLSICKKIMEEHRGNLCVESRPGHGSTFSLYFPFMAPDEAFKTQCWEYMKCGVEEMEGSIENRCHAYPSFGRVCWTVAGTFSEGRVQCTIAEKLGSCKKCDFYRKVAERRDL